MSEKSDSVVRTLLGGAVVALLALSAFQIVHAQRMRDSVERLQATVDAMQSSAVKAEQVQALEETIEKLANDQPFLVDDITRIQRKIDDLVGKLEQRGGPETGEPDEPPQIDWTIPQLFEKAKTSCAEYGIELTADEVRVPSRFVIRQGAIEYFAVLKGGKEHETLISLLGNIAAGERRPRDFGARLNNAIQALGFKRGKRVRYTETGREPPAGETAYLLIEWEEKGQMVRVRAEDLVWNRIEEKPMERNKWVYIGSAFVKSGDESGPVFAADITAEAVATYSSAETIFDNIAKGDSDDTTYLAATPRIPVDIENCTLVIRRKDIEATRTFPADPAGGEGGK